MNHRQLTEIQQLISSEKEISVLVTASEIDPLVGGISLGLSLEKGGKRVFVFAPSLPQDEEFKREIKGWEKVRTELEKKDLTIQFDYPLEKIERVFSQDEGGKLELVVKVKPEGEAISPEQVKIVPAQSLPKIGFVLGDDLPGEEELKEGKWIQLGGESYPSWAQLSLKEGKLSYSALVAVVIQGLGLPLDGEIGRNLFWGIKKATNSFSQVDDYRVFELAAVCFKVFQPREEERRVSSTEAPRIEEVERKEGGGLSSGGFPAPKIFKGATTPRI